VLAVGTEVAVTHGGAKGRTGLLDAAEADGLGGGIEPPVGSGPLGLGGRIALDRELRSGEEVELCIHGLSMQRGCDS